MKRILTAAAGLIVALILVLSGHAYAQSMMLLGVGPEGGATFPALQASATTACASATSCSVNLPASIASGDLLLVCDYQGGNGRAPTLPSGWTAILYDGSAAGTGEAWCLYKLPASGAEGATVTISFASTGTARAVAAYRISPASTIVSGTLTASLDPPSLTPAAGAKNYLWIAHCGQRYSTVPTSVTPPTGYAPSPSTSISSVDSTVSLSWKQLNSTVENPGVCTWVGGATFTSPLSNTMAVAP